MQKFLILLWIAGCIIGFSNSMMQLVHPAYAQVSSSAGPSVRTSGEGLVTRIAPGEFLPFSVKLLNFGLTRRVDVTIIYRILDHSGKEIFSDDETVAVETTATFLKQIPLPISLAPGTYTAVASIVYAYQEVPATSQFEFTVEPKIAGIFRNDFILYFFITIGVSGLGIFLSRIFFTKGMRGRFVPYDYSEKPHEQRIYYEILSDTIAQMRLRVGDDAFEIAKDIPDLEVDPDTGKVLSVKTDPAKIIALLVLRYETLLGQRVSLIPRDKTTSKKNLEPVEKNIDVVRKYFE